MLLLCRPAGAEDGSVKDARREVCCGAVELVTCCSDSNNLHQATEPGQISQPADRPTRGQLLVVTPNFEPEHADRHSKY